ncbi:MAG: heavy-metal-associated domain-containing protein [Kofleriaceae bacterium]
MRMLLVVMVLAVGCQRDAAEQSAHAEKIVVAQKPAAVTKLAAPDLATQQTGKDQTAPKACGGEGEACGPGCTAGTEASPTWAVLPAGTPWTALHVTGMHCGECAKKIERALAKVDGVRGVKIDLDTQKVEIAVTDGHDARTLAKPVIDSLGYHVD